MSTELQMKVVRSRIALELEDGKVYEVTSDGPALVELERRDNYMASAYDFRGPVAMLADPRLCLRMEMHGAEIRVHDPAEALRRLLLEKVLDSWSRRRD